MKFVKIAMMLISLMAMNLALSAAIPAAERQALIDLYNATNNVGGWIKKTNWLGAPGTENTWYGVTTDAGNTTVLQIQLPGNMLYGDLPASIGNFPNLTDLDFGFNDYLSGQIPTALGNLANLRSLILVSNQFGGNIPVELGNLSQLQILDLGGNYLSGGIPPILGNLSQLQSLYLDYNALTGSIPAEIGNLHNLQKLYLSHNLFYTSLPSFLGGLSELTELGLASAHLTGSIPLSFGTLSKLQYLHLGNNELTGGIPAELGNLGSLLYLNLSSNPLKGNIPSELGNLANLQYLILTSNQLTGGIPSGLCSLGNLTDLELYGNYLSGAIPSSVGNLSLLQSLDLSANQLSGSLPPGLGTLSGLRTLSLTYNQLTGAIPSELGDLHELTTLYLDSNQFSSSIPASLGNLSNLTILSLSYNTLTGDIPPDLGNLGKLEYLFLGSNMLSGSIPSSLGNLSALHNLGLETNRLTGNIPPEIGNLENLAILNIKSNQLAGPIPTSLKKLWNLYSSAYGYNDLGYNALYTSDAALLAFLNSKDSDWTATQTIAPTNLTIEAGNSSANFSWTPIPYVGDTGGYRVLYGTTAGGPYTFYAQTANKSASSQLVSGLTAGTCYYFVAQTRTDAHAKNLNVVDSEYSTEVSAIPGVPATILLSSPAGGEAWIVGSLHDVTWTSTNVANVKIEYSTNGGSSYSTVIASTASTGSYGWTVPNTPSTTCLVRLSDEANAAVNDVSNGTFTILAAGPGSKNDFNGDGQADILWRYHGAGGYNSVWFMGAGSASPPALAPNAGTVAEMKGRSPLYADARQAGDGNGPERAFLDPREAMGSSLGGGSASGAMTSPRHIGFSSRKNGAVLSPQAPLPDPTAAFYSGGTGNPQATAVRILGGADLPSVNDLDWKIVGTGDFNGDGKTDLLWRYNGTGGYLCVWYLNGTTVLGGADLPSVADLSWQVAGTGDFNGDGKVDILWRYQGAGGYTCVWFMNGKNVTGGADLPSVSDLAWQIVGLGDFNADGKTDILWRYQGAGGYLCVWFMNGTAVMGGVDLPSVNDLTWQVQEVADFNADGKVDLIWRYYGAGGYNCVWFLNGTTLMGGQDIASVADLLWKIVSR